MTMPSTYYVFARRRPPDVPDIGEGRRPHYLMLRSLGIWVIAAAAITSVALQLEEREDRTVLLNEQRYQSCMAQQIGGAVNLERLEAVFPLSDQDRRQLTTNLDEGIGRCSRRFPHTTTPER